VAGGTSLRPRYAPPAPGSGLVVGGHRYAERVAISAAEVRGFQQLIQFCYQLGETMVVLFLGDEIAKVFDTPFRSFV